MKVLESLEVIGSDQWGVVTTAQAAREGVTRLQLSRLAEEGVLNRARRGVYLLPSHPYGPYSDVQIGWVSLEPSKFAAERWSSPERVVVSHSSAALVHDVGDLIPEKLTYSSSRRKQTKQDDIQIFNHREFDPGDVVNIDGLPVTSPERTAADLAATGIEFNYLATIIVEALRKEGTRLSVLSEKLNHAARNYNFDTGEELVRAAIRVAETVEDRREIDDRFYANVVGPMQTALRAMAVDTKSTESLARALNQNLAANLEIRRILEQVPGVSETLKRVLEQSMPVAQELSKPLADLGEQILNIGSGRVRQTTVMNREPGLEQGEEVE